MIKRFILLLLSIGAHSAYCQEPTDDEMSKLKTVLSAIIPANDNLCDSVKARIIFQWVADKIDYDDELWDSAKPLLDSLNWNKLTRNIDTLLITRKGVCNGISYIYYLLCKQAGLKVLDVLGEVKGYNKGGKFLFLLSYPHTWNMVYWNGKWHQIDCTWALASEKKGKVDWFWFDTKPEKFALTHYAYDQNLSSNFKYVSKQQFQLLPYFGREYFDYFQVTSSMVSTFLNGKSSAQIFFSIPNKNVRPYIQKLNSCSSSFDDSKGPLKALSTETWRQVDAEKNACYSIAVKVKEIELSNKNNIRIETLTTIYELARIGVAYAKLPVL